MRINRRIKTRIKISNKNKGNRSRNNSGKQPGNYLKTRETALGMLKSGKMTNEERLR